MGFPSLLSPVWCQVVEWKGKQFIFLFYVHTYSIHIYIYLYYSVRNQKVEFPMKSLFFNNRLFLNVIRTIILYSYEGFGEGRENMLWGFCFCFSFRVLFFDFFFFLVGHFCTAGISAEPYSGKNNDM